MDDEKRILLDKTQTLLNAIITQDFPTYKQLCETDLTSFEPEALGHLVQGLAFHEHYFRLPAAKAKASVTTQSIVDPFVRLLGADVGIVTFVRLIQMGESTTVAYEETRVWHKVNGSWKQVHFHRSLAGKRGGSPEQ